MAIKTVPSSEIKIGNYTPNIVNVSNVDAVVARQCKFTKLDSRVLVSGSFSLDATTANLLTVIRISLPFSTNITDGQVTLTGKAIAQGSVNIAGSISGDINNEDAYVQLFPTTNANRNYTFDFEYDIQ